MPSRSQTGRLAWHLRWALPAFIASGWFTIETRHQGHAWWLLPNWAVIALHHMIGPGVSRTLSDEFYGAIIERATHLPSDDRLLAALHVQDPIRRVWPRNIEPIGPSAPLLFPNTLSESNRVWAGLAPQLWIDVQAVNPDEPRGESWQRWYPRPLAVTTPSEPNIINAHIQIWSPRSLGRRSLFSAFSRPELLLNRVIHSARPIARCESIDDLVMPLRSQTADLAVQRALGLRLVTFANRWGLSLFSGPIDPEIENLTVGARLDARKGDQIIASARFVVRMGPAGSSSVYGVLPEAFVEMLDPLENPVSQEALEQPSTTFELITDESMVLADPNAQRYWRGGLTWHNLASIAAPVVKEPPRINRAPTNLAKPTTLTPPSPPAADSPAR